MNMRTLTNWAALLAICASLCWGTACFATSDISVNASTMPLRSAELWPAIVSLFSSPDGRIDLEQFKTALHVDPAIDTDPEYRKSGVYIGAVGQDKKLGYRFIDNDQSHWSLVLLWLENPDDIKIFRVGDVPNGMCIPRDKIEAAFIDNGWTELFGYSRYVFPTAGILPATAIFKKRNVEVNVSVTRDGSCLYYIQAAPVPTSKFDMERAK